MTTPIPYRQEVFRKLIHLSSLWMVALILLYPGSQRDLFLFFFVLLILNLLCEFAFSLNAPVITPLYRMLFGRMLRNEVRRGQWIVSGSPPVLAAAALVCLLFSKPYAAIALGVMLIADTAAALIGRKFVRHRLRNGKSLEGTAAFCLSGFIFAFAMLAAMGLLTPTALIMAAIGVLLAATGELFTGRLRIDDNLSVPLIFGLAISCTKFLEYQ